jgi:hypothetical protein
MDCFVHIDNLLDRHGYKLTNEMDNLKHDRVSDSFIVLVTSNFVRLQKSPRLGSSGRSQQILRRTQDLDSQRTLVMRHPQLRHIDSQAHGVQSGSADEFDGL